MADPALNGEEELVDYEEEEVPEGEAAKADQVGLWKESLQARPSPTRTGNTAKHHTSQRIEIGPLIAAEIFFPERQDTNILFFNPLERRFRRDTWASTPRASRISS